MKSCFQDENVSKSITRLRTKHMKSCSQTEHALGFQLVPIWVLRFNRLFDLILSLLSVVSETSALQMCAVFGPL